MVKPVTPDSSPESAEKTAVAIVPIKKAGPTTTNPSPSESETPNRRQDGETTSPMITQETEEED
jgi:hypothetical protein